MQGQHLLRFERGPICASELVTDQENGLPTAGAVAAFLCAGERDFEHDFVGSHGARASGGSNGAAHGSTNGSSPGHGRVVYMTTVQTETLSENLYIATCEEMVAHSREHDSLVHSWDEPGGRGMSIVDVQKYAHEVHVQAYHLLPTGGIVIRTQTIFEDT